MSNKKKLPAAQSSALLNTLKTRFDKNMTSHKGKEWSKVEAKLNADQEKQW